MPAKQCFDAGDLARHKIDLGLVMQDQLLAGDALAQVDEQRELMCRLLLRRGVADGVTAAGALGNVHGHVGATEQLGRGRAVLGEQGNADARRYLDDFLFELEPDRTRPLDLEGDLRCGGEVGWPPGEDREFVSPEPGDRVGLPQRADEALGDLLEQSIALLVAERVVDAFEPVEIHHQHGPRLAVASGRKERPEQVLPKQRAVRQARERVVQRLVLEALDVGLAFGDITHEEEREDLIAKSHLAALHLHRERRTVLALAECLNRLVLPGVVAQQSPWSRAQSAKLISAGGRDHELERPADQTFPAVAEEGSCRSVERLDQPP